MLARPLVWLLSQSTNLVVRLLGGDPAVGRGVMTERGTARPGGRATRRSARTSGTSSARSSTRASGRSARCWCPGPRWSSCPPACRWPRPARRGGQRAVLPVPGVPGVLRRRDRLRARPRPARPAGRPGRCRSARCAGRSSCCRPSKTVLSALSEMRRDQRAPGHRGGRVRRHRGHRHPGGPGRGADRRHPGRVRRGRTGQPSAAPRRRGRGGRAAEPGRVRRADRRRAARGPYETVAGYMLAMLGPPARRAARRWRWPGTG